MKAEPDFYIVTGGPGVGKTTLIGELQRRGYACMREAAREIIREQVAGGGDALPWGNVREYAALMLGRSVDDYRAALQAGEFCFFDRGIPDTLGYARLTGLPLEREWEDAGRLFRYRKTVFVLPPWEEIYRPDTERRQDYAEAVETYRCLKREYRRWGYRPVEVPRLPVDLRADFVLRVCKEDRALPAF